MLNESLSMEALVYLYNSRQQNVIVAANISIAILFVSVVKTLLDSITVLQYECAILMPNN